MAVAKAEALAVATRSRRGASRRRVRRPGPTRRRTGLSCAAVIHARRRRERGTFGLEGTVRRWLSSQEGGGGSGIRAQSSHQNLVAPIDDLPAICRAHLWCL